PQVSPRHSQVVIHRRPPRSGHGVESRGGLLLSRPARLAGCAATMGATSLAPRGSGLCRADAEGAGAVSCEAGGEKRDQNQEGTIVLASGVTAGTFGGVVPVTASASTQNCHGDQQGVLRVIGTQDNQGQNNNSQTRTTTGSKNNGQ